MSINEFMILLDREEADVRNSAEAIRAQLADAEKRLADLDMKAAELAAVRKTAVALAAKAPAKGAAENGRPDTAATGGHEKPGQASETSRRGSLGPLSDKLVTLIVSSGRAWRAREVLEALGEHDAPRDRVHSIRNTLSRLVELGYLERVGEGLYGAPTK